MPFGTKKRKTPFVREPITELEDLRDDCIALFINSGLTQAEVHARGGPTPGTISKWLYKETVFPRLDTIRAFLQAVDYDLMPMPRAQAQELRSRPLAARLHLAVSFPGKPKMPKRKARKGKS